MNQKGFANVILVIIIVIFAGAAGYLVFNNQKVRISIPIATAQTPTSTPVTPAPAGDSSSTPEPNNYSSIVSLGQQFTLKKNQFIKTAGSGLEIGIIEFYNSPCPKDAQCFWSGIGIEFEYRFNGEVKKGMDLVRAFGYQTTIVKTDHETYANLVIEKILKGRK